MTTFIHLLILWLVEYLNHGFASCQFIAYVIQIHSSLPYFMILELEPVHISPLPADAPYGLSVESIGGILQEEGAFLWDSCGSLLIPTAQWPVGSFLQET